MIPPFIMPFLCSFLVLMVAPSSILTNEMPITTIGMVLSERLLKVNIKAKRNIPINVARNDMSSPFPICIYEFVCMFSNVHSSFLIMFMRTLVILEHYRV